MAGWLAGLNEQTTMNAPQALTLSRVNDGVYRVVAGSDLHIGNLKLIAGQWKFKAIGYDTAGNVIPGGGPLTDRHNTTFSAPDDALLNAALGLP